MAVVLLLVTLLSGCRSPNKDRSTGGDPAAIYQNIRGDFQHGNLDTALQEVRKAEKDFPRSGGEWPLKFRLLEAEILIYQGRSPDALAPLNAPGIIYPATGGLAIKRKLLLAMVHMRHGQPQEADEELREAQALSDASHSDQTGEVLLAEAQAQMHRDRLTDATILFNKSLEVARKNNQPFLEATDLMNLGYMALEMEHYDESVALFSDAVGYAKPIQAKQAIELATGNAGVAYFYLGDYDKSLANFQVAEQSAKEMGATSGEIDWLWDEGRAYSKLGRLEEAKKCFEQSLKMATTIGKPEEIAGINAELGFFQYRRGQYDLARTYSDAAMQAAAQSGDKSTEEQAQLLQALLAVHEASTQDAERVLMQVYRDSADEPSTRWEVENALANFYAGGHQSRQAEQWYRRSIQTFETQRSSVKEEDLKLPFFANGDSLYRDYAAFLIASHRPDEALQLLDLGRARTLEEDLEPTRKWSLRQEALDAPSIARRLHATVLFYSLGPDKSWLWAVTAHGSRLFTLPGQAQIDAGIKRYQKAILRSSDPLRETNQDARFLYDTLVAPAASLIPHGSTVFVIPDGSLNGLNFETLLAPGETLLAPPTDGGFHYWIEDVTVTNANSIRMLSRFDTSPSIGGAKSLLLIGNPVSPSTQYEDLPNASVEIGDIQNHFSPTRLTVVTRSNAVPAAYAANRPDRFSYIHFVAHGTASRLSPLDSAVVLSASPGHPDDFKLYARDIVRYPLHARLVTISACYGSGVRAYAGEGLVGLSWAFLRAGAHNVIGALWEASDASTPLLMDRLYTGLNAGSPPDAALRAAKLALIHSDSVYGKPLYWGAFQLYAGS